MFDLINTIYRDTCEFMGRHYYLAFVALFLAVLAGFGVKIVLTVLGVLAVIVFIMYQMPDDMDPPNFGV